MNKHLHFKVKGISRKLHPSTMPLWSIVKGIKENKQLLKLTEQGRALEPEEYKKWKPRNLMAIYFGVQFRDRAGSADLENVSGYTGLAGYDFDDVDTALTIQTLKTIPQVICAGVSASGKGVWCVARVEAATDKEYRMCFAEGIRTFQEAGISGIDLGCHDPTRARFVAADPEFWSRWDAMDDDIPAFPAVGDLLLLRNPNKKKRSKLPKDYNLSPEHALDEVRQILAEATTIEEEDRNKAKISMCGTLKCLAERTGVDAEVYAKLFLETWDAVGSDPEKTRSMVNRLLLN